MPAISLKLNAARSRVKARMTPRPFANPPIASRRLCTVLLLAIRCSLFRYAKTRNEFLYAGLAAVDSGSYSLFEQFFAIRNSAAEPNAAWIGFEEAEMTTRRGFVAGSAALAALCPVRTARISIAAKIDTGL